MSKGHDYSAEHRGRDSSCTSGLQFWPCHSITAETVAKAPSRLTRHFRLGFLLNAHVVAVLNEHFEEDGAAVYRAACQLGCEGIVSKRLGSSYRSGRSKHWIKIKNPDAPATKREAEEDWRR